MKAGNNDGLKRKHVCGEFSAYNSGDNGAKTGDSNKFRNTIRRVFMFSLHSRVYRYFSSERYDDGHNTYNDYTV